MTIFKNIPYSAPVNICEKMNVRPHQVSSKSLFSEKYAAVTAFAFDGGEGVSSISYEGDSIYLLTQGELLVSCDNGESIFSAVSPVYVPSGKAHAISGSKPYKLIQFRFDGGKSFMEKIIKNIDHSKALDLKSLVDYEEDQVVSLTLANEAGVGVTLFAFDKGTGFDTHTTPGDAMPNVIEGEAEFTIGEEKHIVRAGESIVMPIGIPHSVKALTRFKMLLVVVKKA